MTKSKAAPAVEQFPETVELTGPYMTVLHKAAALIRTGYVPDTVTSFGPAWPMMMTLRLGDPDQTYIDAAIVDVAEARALEEARRQLAIEEEARRLVEDRERAARKAAKDAEIAAAEAILNALRKEAAA